MPRRMLSRRTFLKAAGVSLALPQLESMMPARAAGAASRAVPPRRLVAICNTLGFHTPHLFPQEAGRDYTASPYLEALADFRNDFTICSGLAHPGVTIFGHSCLARFLTGAFTGTGYRNTVSLDQLAAEQIGGETRFPSLQLVSGAVGILGPGISVTRSGVVLPAYAKPSQVYAKLFLDGKADDVRDQARKLQDGQSILDAVGSEAKAMKGNLPPRDRDILDEYFGSVREVEQRLVKAEEWARKPKPKVSVPPPKDVPKSGPDCLEHIRLMFDLVHLAIQTDSTRIITIPIDCGQSAPRIEGVTEGHHSLSHHGKRPEKIAKLKLVETEIFKAFGELLGKLKKTREDGATLLDRTMLLFGSHMGNAYTHTTTNLPILLAGGGFKHGQHLAFDPNNGPPLCNLYLSMLQRLGLEIASFGSSKGTLKGVATDS